MGIQLTKAQETTIREFILTKYRWKPNMYTLEWMEDWDQSKIPFIVAIPTQLKVDFSPSFIILKNGDIITMWETDGFQRVISEYLLPLQTSYAKILAELALKFGVFGKPIGVLFRSSFEGRKTQKKLPRTQSLPICTLKGDQMVLEFYTYDYELLRLYDCRIDLKVSGSAIQIQVKSELL